MFSILLLKYNAQSTVEYPDISIPCFASRIFYTEDSGNESPSFLQKEIRLNTRKISEDMEIQMYCLQMCKREPI